MAARGAINTVPGLLGDEVWAELARTMELREFEPGQSLVVRGDLEPDFAVIGRGVAAVMADTAQGERRELSRLRDGECIGEMSLLTGEPASADVVAVTPVVAHVATQQQISDMGDLRGQLITALSTILAGRLQTANERFLARYSSKLTGLCVSGTDLETLDALAPALRRTVGTRVALVIVGEQTAATMRSLSLNEQAADVTFVTPGDSLAPVIDRAAREEAHVFVIGNEAAWGDPELEHVALFHFVRTESLRDARSSHRGGHLVALGDDPWTVPAIQALSDRAGMPVCAIYKHGGDVDRLARTIAARKIGVAFGAGAAKGLAHLGVLRAFLELGVPIDAVSGASIGAAVAAGVAAGTPVDELEALVNRVAAKVVRPTVPLHSLLSNAGVKEEIHQAAGETRIEDLNIPLAIVAVDIFRRAEVTFTSGLVWPRIIASTAIPGVYPPVPALGSYLVDGGILTPVPARQCRELGADIVIGVRLTATRTSPREQLERQPGKPLAVEAMIRAFEIMQNRISEISHEPSDVTIEICVEGTGGLRDFKRGPEIAHAGYAAAMASAPALKDVLPYVKGVSA